jgi:hypothetical protein
MLAVPDPSADAEQFARLGKGDLVFDVVDGKPGVGCLRGAEAMRWDGDGFVPLEVARHRRGVTAYHLPELPCRLLITTAEKKHFFVTVREAAEGGQLLLEYRRADATLMPEDQAPGRGRRSRGRR